jgi:hypothetical protein
MSPCRQAASRDVACTSPGSMHGLCLVHPELPHPALSSSSAGGNRTATRRARKTGRRCCAPESCGWPSGSLQGLIKPGPLFQEALGLNQEQPEPEPLDHSSRRSRQRDRVERVCHFIIDLALAARAPLLCSFTLMSRPCGTQATRAAPRRRSYTIASSRSRP